MVHHSRFLVGALLRHPAVEDCRPSFMLRRMKGMATVSP
jgi:hypothetical protein